MLAGGFPIYIHMYIHNTDTEEQLGGASALNGGVCFLVTSLWVYCTECAETGGEIGGVKPH